MIALAIAIPDWITRDPVKAVTAIVAGCSLLHTLLPPWDWKPKFVEEGLADFPTAQKLFYGAFNNRWYKLIVYTVGYVALNGRSTVWRFISVNNPNGPNANATTTNGHNGQGNGNAGTVAPATQPKP